jgi:CheY-like chemotaxis protein
VRSKTKVMIVEDEPFIALMAQVNLAAAGYNVVGIASSEEGAIWLASRHEPDVALVDIRLSPGDGRAVARHLAACRCAIVFATANVTELDGSRAPALKALCVDKPYDPALLPAVFNMAIGYTRSGVPPATLPQWVRIVGGES